jgi:glycogen operon protein
VVNEFKQMVKALHAAGMEVILDVVFNHTCEGNELGPTLSFRDWRTGHTCSATAAAGGNFSGCGNTVNGNRDCPRDDFPLPAHWVHSYPSTASVSTSLHPQPRPGGNLVRTRHW